MKNLKSIIGLTLVLFASFAFTACSDDDDETLYSEWETVLDNHGSNYTYDDNGQCFGDGGGISKENFMQMFIGYGWKNYGTWEIDENGKRLTNEYYSEMLGVSPTYYYFDNDTKLTTYFHSDAEAGTVKKNDISYSFNERYNGLSRTVLLLDSDEYLQITGWTQGNQPSFCIVRSLGVRNNRKIYGVSIYVQMTDKELSDLQISVK
ncbi:MAG: hypothetical protein WCS15_02440 [Prevotella sp.]